MPEGKLIVVVGPSGVGKRTLIKHVLSHMPQCWFSVSATTRQPRAGEVDGADYHFMSGEAFRTSIRKDGFLEYEEFAGENFYGTPRMPVEMRLLAGDHVIAELEVKGALKVKALLPRTETIFIVPPEPMIETLRQRILERGGVSPESLERRLKTAQEELAQEHLFDHHVVNDELSVAQNEMLWRVRKILKEPAMA